MILRSWAGSRANASRNGASPLQTATRWASAVIAAMQDLVAATLRSGPA